MESNYYQLDTDLSDDLNDKMNRISILSLSHGNWIPYLVPDDLSKDPNNLWRPNIDKGIVVIAAAGQDCPTPYPFEPACFNYTPYVNMPEKDFRIIAVGSTFDGKYLESDCDGWNTLRDGEEVKILQTDKPANWYGDEVFANEYNYSRGNDKFNISTNLLTRNTAKYKSFMDIVAPGGGILVLDGSERKYNIAFGTSLSAPLVSGVIGLMLSINRFMGLPFDEISCLPTGDGADVQRKVYNAITFTTDKLLDGYSNITFKDEYQILQNVQTNYVTQTNDKLKRSWAQRMGFGRVNAYRAVAHAIENKGEYEYNSSEELPVALNNGSPNYDERGYQNEDGKMLLHFGALCDDNGDFGVSQSRGCTSGDDAPFEVLEYGGANKPKGAFFEWEENNWNGETQLEPHNNQGVTKLNNESTNINLYVPDNSILAIDGIVFSPQENMQHQIQTYRLLSSSPPVLLASNGKILTTGYMENVRLKGFLKVSDLFINGANEESAGLWFTDEYDGPEPLISEIYGQVVLLDDAFLKVDACTTEVQPGGIIEMRGNKDIIVENGGVLILNGASTIKNGDGITDRKIIVKEGSKLIVSDDAKVEILTLIEVEGAGASSQEAGGEIIFGKKSIVKLNQFDIKSAKHSFSQSGTEQGKLIILEGTRLSLNLEKDNLCYGKLEIHSDEQNTSYITARLKECCKYICDEVDENSKKKTNIRFMHGCCNYLKIDKNVVFDIGTFENKCWFAMADIDIDGPTFNGGNNQSTMLLLNPSDDFQDNGYDYKISNCTFINEDENLVGIVKKNNTGLKVNNINRITIDSCKFENLFTGVSASSCTFVELSSNTFSNGNIGYLDWGNNSLICSNTFTNIDNGCLYALSLGSKNFNNTYTNNRIPIFNWGYAEHDIRNNSFDEYCSGIYSIGGKVNLGEVFKTYDCAKSFGMNVFNVDNDRMSNPYLPPYRTDVEAYPKDVITIMFGQNKFSEYSDYHLAGDGSISVMHNNFQPDSTVRYKGFNIYDIIELGTSATTTRTCDETCSLPSVDWAFYMNRQYCIDSIYRPFNEKMFYLPPGAIGFYEADSMYNYLIEIMNDPSYDCLCRYQMARRALETGLFTSDVYYKLWSLIDDFYYNDCDTSSCKYKLFKAEIFARMKMYDSAMTYYDDLVLNHNDCEDWMIAKWLRLLTLYEFSSDSAITFDLLDSVYVINDTLIAQADSVYSLLMNTLYEDLKNYPDYPKDSVNVAKGTLDFPNQRKLVAYPIYNQAGVRNEDSLYYHLVYTKVEDGVSNVYYSRSQPVYYDGINPVPQQDIEWGDYEVKLSDMINCSPYSGTFNCAYPSIVVREDSSVQNPVVKAYVVFSVQNDEPLCKDLFNFGANQHAIAEAVFNANLPEESMTFTDPVIIARGNGSDISQWGTPSINASHEGNYYAWSDSLLGIGVKFKEPEKQYFDVNMQTNYVDWSSTYTQQYPSLNTYSRIDQGENEAALVWQEGIDEINTHIYYTRLKVNGNRTLVNNDLPDSIAIKAPPVPLVNADTTILNVSEDEMSNKYPVIYRSIQDGSFSNPSAERSFDRIAWQTDSSNILPETYNCSGTISYNPKVINNRVITVNTSTSQLADVYPIATIWHEGGKNLRYPTVAQGNYFQAGILKSIITEFNSLNGCNEADETEYVIWHYPHGTYSIGGGYTDIENIGLAKQLSYKGLYPHLAARPFLRDTGSYWQNRRVFLTPDSIISEITVSNEYFAKLSNEISYKAIPFFGFDNKQKRMLVSSVKVDSKSIPFNLVEFYSYKDWYLKDTMKTDWFKVNDISDLDFLQFGDDNVGVKMLIEKKTDKEKTRMDIIPLRPGKVAKAKYKLINGKDYYYRILLVKEANLSHFRENIAIMQWPYIDKTDDGLNKKVETGINVIDLGHSSLEIEGNSLLLNVFPNPADNLLYVTAYYPQNYILNNSTSDIITIQLYSSIGNKLIEIESKAGETIQIPLGKFTQGVYFIRVKEKSGNLQQQIMPAVKSVVIEK